MKTEELMLRDYFTLIDFNGPTRITAIYDDVVQLQENYKSEFDGEWYSEAYIKDLKPIPLTAEILEKNGFSHIMYSDAYYSIMIGDTYVELRKYENMAVWFNWKENNDGVYADYILPMPQFVHQLQHALRLCNIEKEIEL